MVVADLASLGRVVRNTGTRDDFDHMPHPGQTQRQQGAEKVHHPQNLTQRSTVDLLQLADGALCGTLHGVHCPRAMSTSADSGAIVVRLL